LAGLVDTILQCLDANKAEDIVAIDLTGKSSLTDTMIIASGRSDRHVGAVTEHLLEHLKARGVVILGVEGMANRDWVLVDAGDVIVHIFRPEVRTFYRLERLWQEEAPKADAERFH
jgi:ribosome-associated protein